MNRYLTSCEHRNLFSVSDILITTVYILFLQPARSKLAQMEHDWVRWDCKKAYTHEPRVNITETVKITTGFVVL